MVEHDDIVVAIADRNPVFAFGLATGLKGAGWLPEVVDDLILWAPGPGHQAAFLDSGVGDCYRIVPRLHAIRPLLAIVVLVASDDVAAHETALQQGASASACRNAPLKELVAVMAAALELRTRLPTDVAHSLASRDRPACDVPHLALSDRLVLSALAKGLSVGELARRDGCSERSMHRRLRALYDSIGAGNRSQAVALAARWGLAPVTVSQPDGSDRWNGEASLAGRDT